MIAFLCATPYQIFNVVNIKLSMYADEPADLYLLNFATDLLSYRESLQSSGLFENIYMIDDFNNPSTNLVISLCLKRHYPTKDLLTQKVYTALFVTCMGFCNTIFYSFLSRNNPDLSLYYYDEGIGIYTTPILNFSTKLNIFFLLTGFKNYANYINCLYLYLPDARTTNLNYPTQKISPVKSSSLIDQLRKVFTVPTEKSHYNTAKFIFLDQAFKKQIGLNIDYPLLLDQLTQNTSPQDWLIKAHPTRLKTDPEYSAVTSKFNIQASNDIPWEILLLNIKNIENKVFISVNSTACVTAKMIYDKEPTVILLYKLIPEYMHRFKSSLKEIDQFFSLVRASYREPSKFFIPNNYKELQHFLQSI
ncbi:hypothetical protein [Neobittarella massiliensis]|uniref:hypothetical protein n=1 Tax=Neobittarella massiliensis (ex Bilen et al. 2018) TaxID=2041842 RepID=UPI00101AE4B6|nr:hypothetical protein [Neobittarella massiliensis]